MKRLLTVLLCVALLISMTACGGETETTPTTQPSQPTEPIVVPTVPQDRYWYDNGLHSGDDWNMVIAKHLKGSAACLLLLSPNSAESEYVKNELNFAMNHRIPIHTLLLKQFDLPLDIEMMTGRIQMVEMEGNFQTKLIKALPPEIFSKILDSDQEKDDYNHNMFEILEPLSDRQGTKMFSAKHKRLNYPCTVLEERLQSDEIAENGKIVLYFFSALKYNADIKQNPREKERI